MGLVQRDELFTYYISPASKELSSCSFFFSAFSFSTSDLSTSFLPPALIEVSSALDLLPGKSIAKNTSSVVRSL